ncbi:MAG: DegT/DnrJ/EryC1/StrS family aminotransferase [Eubacteriales bacterium]|jgi:perosamine synthetase|nr:DegT/DnrJ/EryC1/StrS family aminotransferase [Eubacteriales bacterium]
MPSDKLIAALAVNGGSRTITTPLEPRRHFGQEEKEAINRVIDAAINNGVAPGYGGPEEESFCKEFADIMGGGYADAVNSGTTSIFVALRALEPEPFSEIITPPVTDPGGIMPVVMMNCIPVIADSEKGSFNISLDSIKERYTANTSVILAAHIAGEPCDIEGIKKFADEKGIHVVEDAAQSHGASINGKMTGTYGAANGFSLMFGKHVCVGGQGGMVFTKDESVYYKIRQNSDRGKPFGYDGNGNAVASLNFNMDEMHCAAGRVQIKKIKSIAEGRRRVVSSIREKISDIPAIYFNELPRGAVPSHWFMRMLFREGFTSCDKFAFCSALSAEGVPVNAYYAATPYTSDWYTKRHVFGFSGYPWAAAEYKGDRNKYYSLDDLPNTAKALNDTIMLFALESWSETNINQVCDAFHKVYEAYKI